MVGNSQFQRVGQEFAKLSKAAAPRSQSEKINRADQDALSYSQTDMLEKLSDKPFDQILYQANQQQQATCQYLIDFVRNQVIARMLKPLYNLGQAINNEDLTYQYKSVKRSHNNRDLTLEEVQRRLMDNQSMKHRGFYQTVFNSQMIVYYIESNIKLSIRSS